jgi:anthranilate phosphoribosyltransferase
LVTDGQDLTRAEASAAMTDILSGAVSPARIAGLLVGLRMKGETGEELTGMVRAMQAAAEPLRAPPGAIDIVGTGGSAHRRRHALNVSTMAAFVAAGAGAIVCKHGNRRASSTSGSFDFLEAVGVRAELAPDRLVQCMATTGLGFAFARTFHPAMRHAAPVRAELGIPTVFNVLGPLANPGGVTRYLLGTSSPDLGARMAGVLANLGSAHSWVVSGSEGIDELSVTGPSTVHEVTPDGVRTFELDPAEVGLASGGSLEEVAGGTAEDNVVVFRGILDGSLTGPKRDIVVLNAAAGLVVAGLGADLAAEVCVAAAAIADGRAAAKLAELVQVTAVLSTA